jgi:hypothetical protein
MIRLPLWGVTRGKIRPRDGCLINIHVKSGQVGCTSTLLCPATGHRFGGHRLVGWLCEVTRRASGPSPAPLQPVRASADAGGAASSRLLVWLEREPGALGATAADRALSRTAQLAQSEARQVLRCGLPRMEDTAIPCGAVLQVFQKLRASARIPVDGYASLSPPQRLLMVPGLLLADSHLPVGVD